MTQKTSGTAYLVWLCAVLFYLYQYILRVSPSVMADDLMSAFQITASGFSSLSAFAVYCYALMQIPVGMLVDHYGTRRTMLTSIVLCIAGVSLFASCEQLIVGYLARMLMGTGSACAFLSVSKIVNEWFPDHKKGFLMGLTATFGTVGALLGGKPLVMLIEQEGWRTSLLILAGFGVFIFLFNFLALPSSHKGDKVIVPGEESTSFQSLVLVFKNKQAWLFSLVAIGIYLSIAVVADLWGVSFITEKFNIPKAEAAQMISSIYFGTAFGCPLFAWINRLLGSIRKTVLIGGVGTIILLGSLVFVPHIPLSIAYSLCFGIGFCAGAEILCFIGACEMMGPEVSGTTTGFLNCMVTLASAMIQQHVGIILDYFWDGDLTPLGIPVYSLHTYQIAFSIIVSFTLISCILACFLRTTPKLK